MSCDDAHPHEDLEHHTDGAMDDISKSVIAPALEENCPPQCDILNADFDRLAVSGHTARGRFAPGKSGNRRGRPRKRPEAIDDTIWRVLNEEVQITQDGRVVQLSFIEEILRSMCYNAVKDPRIGRDILKLALSRLPTTIHSEMDGQIARGQDILDSHLARMRRRLTAELSEGSERGIRATDNDNWASETSIEGDGEP